MSVDEATPTQEDRLSEHIAKGLRPETQLTWSRSYTATRAAPAKLALRLQEGPVYGGEEVQVALAARLAVLRVWVEGLTFEDWWLYLHPSPRMGQASHERVAWRTLVKDIRRLCNPYLRVGECRDRHVYRLNSRNLTYGVFVSGRLSFYGVRTKFGDRFIAEESHWDNGPPHGTAYPQEDLGTLPDDIEAVGSFGPFEVGTGRRVWWDQTAVDEGHSVGRRRYADTNEFCDNGVYRAPNKALLDYLDALQAMRKVAGSEV
jgi:hypothetical protein